MTDELTMREFASIDSAFKQNMAEILFYADDECDGCDAGRCVNVGSLCNPAKSAKLTLAERLGQRS